MQNFSKSIDEIYEFLDEILGSLVPGVYFCSYFIITIWAFISFYGNAAIKINEKLFILIFIIISYVLGTMFRRSNSREPDHYSAKFIYFNSVPHDDNDFSFTKLISDVNYNMMVSEIEQLKKSKKIKIKLNLNKIKKRKRKFRIFEKIFNSSYKKRNNNFRLYSKPEIQNYIYRKLLKRKNKLEKLCRIKIYNNNITNETNEIDYFIKKYKLAEYCNIYVDYPYDNLKSYLKERGMDNLAKYISWDTEDGCSKTTRTKSLICNMKSYIKHISPSDYNYLQKTEAHIRFMNSIWYANKLLFKISTIFLVFGSLLSTSMFLVINHSLLSLYYDKYSNSFTTKIIKFIIDSGKDIMIILFSQDFARERLLRAIICIVLISFLYVICAVIIRRTLENNFHYQRIREVVSVIYIYDMLKKEHENN